jgi:predicted small lipoprotein YifL
MNIKNLILFLALALSVTVSSCGSKKPLVLPKKTTADTSKTTDTTKTDEKSAQPPEYNTGTVDGTKPSDNDNISQPQQIMSPLAPTAGGGNNIK